MPINPATTVGQRVGTESSKIYPAPPEFVALAKDLEVIYEQEIADKRLKLISKHERYSHNSWAHHRQRYTGRQCQYTCQRRPRFYRAHLWYEPAEWYSSRNTRRAGIN